MSSIFKKVAVAVAALLVVGLAGCSNGGEKTTETAVAKRNDPSMYNERGTFPIVKERKTVSILTTSSPLIQDFDTNYMTKRIEEKTGVDLEFHLLPATDGGQKFAVMVASQTELPDILNAVPGSFDDYCYKGIAIPVNDYYADPEVAYYFHQATTEEDRDMLLKNSRLADGNNYSIFRYSRTIWNEYAQRAWINKPWLDKLGLPMPETTEDFYNTLVAFKNNDMNGNGVADEIPFMGSTDGWNQNPIPYLMNAFIYTDPKQNYMFVEDGKIDVAFNKPEWKEGLEYINKLVKEGLLSPLSFTQNVNQFKTILEDPDKQVMGSIAAASLTVYTDATSSNRQDMQPMKPLTGPNGKCYATYNPSVPNACTFISKYCEDPETAFRVLDYLYEPEMGIIARYGEPDVHWRYLTEEEKATAGTDFLGNPVTYKELVQIWNQPQNSHWIAVHPCVSMGRIHNVMPAATDMTDVTVPLYVDKHPEEIIAMLTHTSDELLDLSDIETSIKSYVQECMTRFVMGDKPFSEWDSYVKELEDMGLEQYLEIKQAAFDRMNGK